MSNNQLPNYLREQLKQRKWSGRTLAMYAKVSHSTIARAINGTHIPGPENLAKIAIALEVTPVHLLHIAGHIDPPAGEYFDPSATYIAQRLSKLPRTVRESAIETVGAVVDNIYTMVSLNEAAAQNTQHNNKSENKERRIR